MIPSSGDFGRTPGRSPRSKPDATITRAPRAPAERRIGLLDWTEDGQTARRGHVDLSVRDERRAELHDLIERIPTSRLIRVVQLNAEVRCIVGAERARGA